MDEEDCGRLDDGGAGGEGGCCEDVAMTKNVVRSNKTTSVALHASASFARCFVRTEALGIRV